MSELFPTFSKMGLPPFRSSDWQFSNWLSTPWWSADTRASKQISLLRVLATGIEERLDLAKLVDNFADEHRWRFRSQLRRLAGRLAEGTPLADALEQTPGVLSDDQILGIRFGVQSGTLKECLQQLIDRSDPELLQLNYRMRQLGFYLGIVGTLFVLVMSFMLLKIFPDYQKIFADFNIETSNVFQFVYEASVFITREGVILPLLLLMFVLLILYRFESPRRFVRQHLSTRLIRSQAKLRVASVLELLAIAQDAGRPVASSLSTLARYHFDSLIRQKLLFVRNEVEQGTPAWESMATARLISSKEALALQHASNAGTTAWTLRRLAAWKSRIVARRYDKYLDIAQPLLILVMAAFVLVAAMASLAPIFDLTTNLV